MPIRFALAPVRQGASASSLGPCPVNPSAELRYAQPECPQPFAPVDSQHRPTPWQPPLGESSAIRTREPATIFSSGSAEWPCERVRAENPPRARAYNSPLPSQKGIRGSLLRSCRQRVQGTCQTALQAQIVPLPPLSRPWPPFSDADHLSDCRLGYPLYTNRTQTREKNRSFFDFISCTLAFFIRIIIRRRRWRVAFC